MPLFATELGRIIFSVLATESVRGLLSLSGRSGLYGANPNKNNTTVGADMPYDFIGEDDDDFGAIGADLIGADEDDLLEALAVSGDLDDLIGGDGTSEIVGATSTKARKKAALRRLAARNAGGVVKRALNRKRRYPLGFVPTAVAAGAYATIPAAPQNLFRPERLVIPSDIAFDLGIRDIKVGNQSQLAQSAEVPAAMFSEVAINTGVNFDTAEVGNQVSVEVRNKSAGSVEFSAGLVGTLAK